MFVSSTDERAAAPTVPPWYRIQRATRYSAFALLTFVACMALTAVAVHLTNQRYRSEAVILHRQISPESYGVVDVSGRASARLRDMLLASSRLERVIQKFNLYPDLTTEAAVDEIKKAIELRAQGSTTFGIAFTGHPPKTVQDVTRYLAESLIGDDSKQRNKEAEETRRFLEKERTTAEEDLHKKEAALQAFLRENPQAAMVNSALDQADRRDQHIQQQIAALRLATPLVSGPSGDAALLALRRSAEGELERAHNDLADKRDRLTDVHPDVIVANERVRRAEAELKKAEQALAQNAPAAANQAAASVEKRIAEIRRLPSSQTSQVSRQALQLEVQLQSLRHQVQEARERVTRIEDQRFRASMVEKMETTGELGQLTLLDPPYLPARPSSDRKKKVGLAGMCLSAIIALLAAFARSVNDDRIFDAHDLAMISPVPVLVVIPRPTLKGPSRNA